jgi:predicted amidophosphoribosyltransferase
VIPPPKPRRCISADVLDGKRCGNAIADAGFFCAKCVESLREEHRRSMACVGHWKPYLPTPRRQFFPECE